MDRISVEREPGTVVVSARGELDAFTAPELADAFVEAGARDGERLVIDLSLVSFMDSTALGLVVRTVNEATERGSEASLVLPETNARRIFEITTLDRVLPIAASRAAAILPVDAPDEAGRPLDATLGD